MRYERLFIEKQLNEIKAESVRYDQDIARKKEDLAKIKRKIEDVRRGERLSPEPYDHRRDSYKRQKSGQSSRHYRN